MADGQFLQERMELANADPDEVLERAKGRFSKVVVLGLGPDGTIVMSSESAPNANLIIDWAKHHLLFNGPALNG